MSCTKSIDELTNSDYNSIQLICNSTQLSNYAVSGTVNNKPVCYSTNTPLYNIFYYKFSTSLSEVNTPNSKKRIEFGIGGLGSASALPAPLYFSIETPLIPDSLSFNDYLRATLTKGKYLDISVSDSEKQIHAENKFSISLFAEYTSSSTNNANVANFYTWTGVQDSSAYLRVVDVKQQEKSLIITIAFQCKLYDNHGLYYCDVKDTYMTLLL